MKAIVIHGAKDLRVEPIDQNRSEQGRSGCALRPVAFAARTCIITITVASREYASQPKQGTLR